MRACVRRAALVFAILVAAGCAAPEAEFGPVPASQGPAQRPQDPTSGTSDNTLALADGGIVRVEVDRGRVREHGPRRVTAVARHGPLVALIDSYSSRPQELGRCGAGEERWFRVVDVRHRAERYARLVDSCVGGEQWGDPPLTVSRDGTRITLNLLSAPAVDVVLDNSGRVTASR